MRLKYFFVFVFVGFLSIVNIDFIRATCYKVYTSDGSYQFVLVDSRTVCNPETKNCSTEEDEIEISDIVKKEPVTESYCVFGEDVVDDYTSNNSSLSNYNPNNLVSCGNGLLTDVPKLIPKTVHIIYMILQIVVPILLVIFGSIDFIKAIIAQKDDEIKRGQQVFIKRLITGILVFFVFAIVKLVVNFVNSDSNRGIDNVMNCVNCFINNNCGGNS